MERSYDEPKHAHGLYKLSRKQLGKKPKNKNHGYEAPDVPPSNLALQNYLFLLVSLSLIRILLPN